MDVLRGEALRDCEPNLEHGVGKRLFVARFPRLLRVPSTYATVMMDGIPPGVSIYYKIETALHKSRDCTKYNY